MRIEANASEIEDVKETDLAFRFGGGVDVYVTDHISLDIGGAYVLPIGDVEDLRFISIRFGIQYRFFTHGSR
jgi:opacity protein-like surface antigen